MGVENDGSRRSRREIKFRIYPVNSYTGVCANGAYERALGVAIYNHIKKYYGRSTYRAGRIRELYEKNPDGYTCKIFEMPIIVYTKNKVKDKIIWIENY